MEEIPTYSMGKAGKITRNSIHKFLQHYQYFTSIAALIALPFSISVLVSQAIIPRSFALVPTIYGRLHALLHAAGFPPSSYFFSLLSLKLSQTICSSIITFPFSISFLLLAKSSIIHFFFNQPKKSPHSSFITLYNPILSTHMCNTFIIFAANATCFSLLFLAFNFLESFNLNSMKWVILFSVFGSVFYSVILANALIVCNLALVSSGVHKDGGFMSILKACVLIRGKTSTALALAVPINIGLAAVEALFHFRIIASFTTTTTTTTSASFVALEGVLIAYIYSILLVLDVIMSCMLYQYCEFDHGFLGQNNQRYDYINSVMEVEEDCYYDYDVEKLKGIEEFV